MTQKRLNQILKVWQKRLNLTHWTIKLVFNERVDEGHDAEVQIAESYDEANIRIPPEFKKWSLAYSNRIIVHELVHCHLERIGGSINVGKELFSPQSWAFYKKRINHEIEHSTETLSVILHECYGDVEDELPTRDNSKEKSTT